MFSERISNCFDSHVHWLATGEVHNQLRLNHLASATDVATLKIENHHARGDWLLGFGWDQNSWPEKIFPDRHILDQALGAGRAVAFTRADGHALWVNTEALRRAGLLNYKGEDPQGGRILRDSEGQPTGIFIDTAMKLIEKLIPLRPRGDSRRALLKGMQIFNKAGFTHIRDLSCTPEQWDEAVHLEESGLLTLAVEQFFSVEEGQNFENALSLALRARRQKTVQLRPQGVKIFADGALGSEGAWVSCPYRGGAGRGLQLYSAEEIRLMMGETWSHGLDLAVHAIGDEAAHQIFLALHELKEKGINGRLHLEHAELLRPETVKLMAGENVRCHLQPCHWLSDQKWLEQKIGSLFQFAFPWRALQEAGVSFDFGSDSPIEEPSVRNNLQALSSSAKEGIPSLLGGALQYHAHSDNAWVPNCYTVFADGVPTEVVFNGRHLI